MALLTDAGIVDLNDLLQFEGSLVQVSSTHAIDVLTKIRLAIDGISDKITLFLLRAGQPDPRRFNHVNFSLSTVVVTPAIYKWICLESLSRIFAEAYNLQLNTRFQGKWTEYQKQAHSASEIVFASGIGVVADPLPKPGLPIVLSDSGTLAAQSLFISTAWVNEKAQEGELSPINGIVLNGFSRVQVGMSLPSSPVPPSAVGWNVYVSETQERLTRQNVELIPCTQIWQMPQSGVIGGSISAGGQLPARFISSSRRWLRG